MRNVTEIQQRLVDLGFPPEDGVDGRFGPKTLAAYNRYLGSHGKPPHPAGMILLSEVAAELFPADAPSPKPRRNTVFGDILKTFIINQIKGRIPMFGFLDGYKTLIVGIVCIATGLVAMIGWNIPGLPVIPPADGWQLIMTGLAALGLRSAIAKA